MRRYKKMSIDQGRINQWKRKMPEMDGTHYSFRISDSVHEELKSCATFLNSPYEFDWNWVYNIVRRVCCTHQELSICSQSRSVSNSLLAHHD